jgi:hypothetical protein
MRSFVRAVFTTTALFAFGCALALTGGSAVRWIGVVLVVVSVIEGSDFFVYARRWTFVDRQFRIPRWWAPHRAVPVTEGWLPSSDIVSRRDTMFKAETPAGPVRVAPNLMVARPDVLSWLDVIGDQRARNR